MRILGGLSFKEIGEIQLKNENWARVTFYRAKMKLRERGKDNNGNKCNIVRGLLPSYIDHLCSQDSIHFIEEHMNSCEKCREVLESMKNDVDFSDEIDEVYKVEVKLLHWITLYLIRKEAFLDLA